MINNYKKQKRNALTKKIYLNCIKKSFMHRNAINNVTKLTKGQQFCITPRRYYPNKYRVVRVKPLTEDEKQRYNLAMHDTTHFNLQDTQTGKLEAIFTSAKKANKGTPFGNLDNVKLDAVKYDGSCKYLVDKQKKPILDANGNPIPDPNKGGQYLRVYDSPRIVEADAKHNYVSDNKNQSYVDKHEDKIKEEIDKKRALLTSLPKKIGGADDEPLS